MLLTSLNYIFVVNVFFLKKYFRYLYNNPWNCTDCNIQKLGNLDAYNNNKNRDDNGISRIAFCDNSSVDISDAGQLHDCSSSTSTASTASTASTVSTRLTSTTPTNMVTSTPAPRKSLPDAPNSIKIGVGVACGVAGVVIIAGLTYYIINSRKP